MTGRFGEVVLRAENIVKLYPGTTALKDVTFNVYRGKVNVLVGENGAGKSTLMKIIAGVERPTLGRIVIDGEPVDLHSTLDASAKGIGIVFQELNLFPNMDVAENIHIAREITQYGLSIDQREQQRVARDLMQRLEQDIEPTTLVGDLRIGQQQIIEIAKSLARDAKILIMDEPTSALSAAEVEVLFRTIAELKAKGVSIVYISHRLEELPRIGDVITVLRDGEFIAEEEIAKIDTSWIIDKMVGRKSRVPAEAATVADGPVVLQAENITLPREGGGYLVDHVDLAVRAGEIVGIYGLMGAGRSELFDCLMGRLAVSEGIVSVEGEPAGKPRVDERLKAGLALVPEDRQRDGLVQIMSVGHNMTLASLGKYLKWGFHIQNKPERSAIAEMVRRLTVKVADTDLEITSLSGGNQQKALIGRALLTDPKVLLLDEPSRGIDVGAKAEVFQTMRQLAEAGLAIAFITSDLEEIMAIPDRIVVMSNGRVTGQFRRDEATREALVSASAIGHGPAGQRATEPAQGDTVQ
ncbi:sugar ABC transporter ATP-binding protein [Consotaella aegiceratis]|uniref:sugar ABC transporter ATP-binding protein n=1 Tax=Consotaella aegiceratis TaxID=3097961 RepID=UPI002F40F279